MKFLIQKTLMPSCHHDSDGVKLRHRQIILLILLTLNLLILYPTSIFQNTGLTDIGDVSTLSPRVLGQSNENYEVLDLSTLNMSLILNETAGIVEGNLSIDYHNSDVVPFSRIPFHLYLSGMQAHTRPGSVVIHNVTTLSSVPVMLDFNVFQSQQLMWVNLTEDLQPGNSIGLWISFTSILPIDSDDRAGVNGDDFDESKIYEFASAYPLPCVYDEYDGWNVDPYLDVGDPFYLDMAYYNYTIHVPSGMKLAATGEVTETIVDDDFVTYCFNVSRPIREMTFSASRYYIIESQNIGETNVSVYYLPESVSLWESNALFWAVRALDLYNDTFGAYPYSTLNVVEDFGWYYGMEYPCQVYMSNIIYDFYREEYIPAETLDSVIAHEIGHQWWYHLIGNDEIDVGFLDEGLTCWTVYYYSEFYNLGWSNKENDFASVRLIYPALINQSIYDDPDIYYFAAYTKAPVVIEKLRMLLGDDAFLNALHYFFEQFSYKIAFLCDFQNSFEEYLSEDLDWFFHPMFDNEYLPKYSFDSVVYNTESRNLTIIIEDLNAGLLNYRYSQQFDLEVWTPLNVVVYHVELYGTTQLVLHISESITGLPTRVTLDYDDYTLVQQDSESLESLSTTSITIIPATTVTTTTTTTTTTSTTTSTGIDFDSLIPIMILGGGCVIVLVIIILFRRK